MADLSYSLDFELLRVTEVSALASARFMGMGDEQLADRAATEAMQRALAEVSMQGTVAVGRGEEGEEGPFSRGQQVGSGGTPPIEVALDPLEGTTICATGGPNSLSVIAVGPPGSFPAMPATYMEKIAVGPGCKGLINLGASVAENVEAIAQVRNCLPEELTVVILDRPRHRELIQQVRQTGARIKLIGDGDVSAAIATAVPDSGVDILMGIGGARQGVLAAAALQCLRGDMQCRLAPRDDDERSLVEGMGLDDPLGVLTINDLARPEDLLFAATGVTDGDLLKGVRLGKGRAITHSILLHLSGIVRFIKTTHLVSGAEGA